MEDFKLKKIAHWYNQMPEAHRLTVLSALSTSQRELAFIGGWSVTWQQLPQYAKDLVTDEWHAVFMPYPEIKRRYPLLIASMQWAAILTTTEAADCIRALKEGRGSGEAVQHFGGPVEVFKAALRVRKWAYEVWRYKQHG